jgi:hypothetical protein
MLPRSASDQSDHYVCRTRKADGSCDMPILRRVDVDSAVLAMFETSALDYEATRAHVASQLQTTVTDVGAHVDRAEREANGVRTGLARVERDYLSGDLSAGRYEDLSARLEEDLRAAEAEVTRLRAQADSAAVTLTNLDDESETLQRLTALRAAVVGTMNAAGPDIGALRAAMSRVFSRFTVVRLPALGPGVYVAPAVRPEMQAGRDTLRRVAIPFEPSAAAENNESTSGVPE